MTKDSNYFRTEIVEEGRRRHSNYTAEQILDQSCTKFGASLKGRKDAVKEVLNSTSKLPVLVDEGRNIFMFPTASLKNNDCVWLAYHHIKFFEARDDKTYIGFHDGMGIYVNASENVIDMQYKRTSQLIIYFNWRNIFGGSSNDY